MERSVVKVRLWTCFHIQIHNNADSHQLTGSIATDYTQNTPNCGLFTEMACYNWQNRLAGMRSLAVGVQ